MAHGTDEKAGGPAYENRQEPKEAEQQEQETRSDHHCHTLLDLTVSPPSLRLCVIPTSVPGPGRGIKPRSQACTVAQLAFKVRGGV